MLIPTKKKVAITPDITFWPKMKCQSKIWLIGHCVHYAVYNGNSVTLHGCVDFLRRAFKLKRYRKCSTSLALTWRNVHGETLILLGTPFLLTPWRAKAWDFQWLCVVNSGQYNCPYVWGRALKSCTCHCSYRCRFLVRLSCLSNSEPGGDVEW
jgi:hypothetical protein